MHRRVGWLKAGDFSILQVLNRGLKLKTGDIAYNAGLSRNYASGRIQVLLEKGLVERFEEDESHDRYAITEFGISVLMGDIPAEELAELE